MAGVAGGSGALTRAKVLGCACELLAEVGPDAFSTREVARRAEVQVGTVHYHFKGKKELVDACLDTVDDQLLELSKQFRNSYVGQVQSAEAVALAVRAALAFARARQPFFRLLEATIASAGGLDPRRFNSVQKPFLRDVSAWLSDETGLDVIEQQLRIKSAIILVTRYAIMRDETMMAVTETDSVEEALAVIESHLVSATLDLVVHPGPPAS